MSIFDFFRPDSPNKLSPLTRKQKNEIKVKQADLAMKEAGRLFDKTVLQLAEAQASVKSSISECKKEIESLQKQIKLEEETAERLVKRDESIAKVMNSVKSLFMFEDFEEPSTDQN